jgi:predicted esterase
VNDVNFIDEMVKSLKTNYNIDSNAIFVIGESNGAMFSHYLVSQLPNLARAVMPIYGLPLVGKLNVPKTLSNTPILQMHDRSDTTIPW